MKHGKEELEATMISMTLPKKIIYFYIFDFSLFQIPRNEAKIL